ncbi:LysR family transcriptional regulator [Xanthobacteraceae bacterium Astr-EGSB]|uniref:LysR family transcriptional regulator n=1 Tax=Astrobacterium formosum TaxID=3069710 RepID=UPI0027B13C6C|nr:LysR family transcriptional regulator [Xanthobacteraceae bacterium Astr-EGSB]
MQDWDNLRVFLAVARSGQFSAAGRRLKLDHATVARRIAALEAEAKAQLFQRLTTGAVLTSAGESLLVHAEAIEAQVLSATAELANTEATVAGPVRIAGPEGFVSYFLVPRLAAFVRLYPDATLQLVPLVRSFSLARREADIAITLDRPKEGRLTVKKLTDYRVSLYASRNHLETVGPIRKMPDLADRTLVTFVDDLVYSSSLDYAQPLLEASRNRFECVSVTAQIEAIRSGIGAGVIHDYAAQNFSDLVRVLPSFSAERSYWIVTHKTQRSLRRVAATYAFIEDEVRKAGSLFFKQG